MISAGSDASPTPGRCVWYIHYQSSQPPSCGSERTRKRPLGQAHDMAWHQLTPAEVPAPEDVTAFEAAALEAAW